MIRKFFFWLHFGSGLGAGLIIFTMSLTGIFLAFEPQIVAAAEREVRQVTAPVDARAMPLGDLLDQARARAGAKELTGLTLWPGADRSVQLQYGRADQAWINPYDGSDLGPGATGARSFFRTVMGLHRWLGLGESGRDAGRMMTGVCNLAFVFLCLSGLYLWWPRRWSRKFVASVSLFRGGLTGKAKYFNWHNVLGLWSLPVLLALALTGAVISYPWAGKLLYTLSGSPAPPERGRGPEGERPRGNERRSAREGRGEQTVERGRRGKAERDQAPRPRDARAGEGSGQALVLALDVVVADLRQRHPQWQKISLRLPRQPEEPIRAQLYHRDSARPSDRQSYEYAALTGALLKSERYADQNTGQKLRSWVRPLHTGEALGLGGQIAAAAGSAIALVLVWTGVMLAWYRLSRNKKQDPRPKTSEP